MSTLPRNYHHAFGPVRHLHIESLIPVFDSDVAVHPIIDRFGGGWHIRITWHEGPARNDGHAFYAVVGGVMDAQHARRFDDPRRTPESFAFGLTGGAVPANRVPMEIRDRIIGAIKSAVLAETQPAVAADGFRPSEPGDAERANVVHYMRASGMGQILADLALPDGVFDPARGFPRGTRRRAADASRYGADVVVAWACHRIDGETVAVLYHTDKSWSHAPVDELDAPDRRRLTVAADSLDLAVAQSIHEIRNALIPVRLAVGAEDGEGVASRSAGTRVGILAAVDRSLAEMTLLTAVLEREESRRG